MPSVCLTLHSRVAFRVPRAPDLASQHMFVQEPDDLVLVHELAVFEALVGAEFLRHDNDTSDSRGSRRRKRAKQSTRGSWSTEIAHLPFLLLWTVRLIHVLGPAFARLGERTSAVGEKLDIEGCAALSRRIGRGCGRAQEGLHKSV